MCKSWTNIIKLVWRDYRPPSSPYPPEPPSAFPKVNWQQFDNWIDFQSSSESTDRTEDNVDMRRWWREGLQLVADGKVAVVVLAGGQSTRLGPSAPPVKGMVDLGLPDGKSLFQQQAERLLLVQELASLVCLEHSDLRRPNILARYCLERWQADDSFNLFEQKRV